MSGCRRWWIALFEIRSTEATAQAMIDTRVPVYKQEASLAEAKNVNGLRAVFDEVAACELLRAHVFVDVVAGLSGSRSCGECWGAG